MPHTARFQAFKVRDGRVEQLVVIRRHGRIVTAARRFNKSYLFTGGIHHSGDLFYWLVLLMLRQHPMNFIRQTLASFAVAVFFASRADADRLAVDSPVRGDVILAPSCARRMTWPKIFRA